MYSETRVYVNGWGLFLLGICVVKLLFLLFCYPCFFLNRFCYFIHQFRHFGFKSSIFTYKNGTRGGRVNYGVTGQKLRNNLSEYSNSRCQSSAPPPGSIFPLYWNPSLTSDSANHGPRGRDGVPIGWSTRVDTPDVPIDCAKPVRWRTFQQETVALLALLTNAYMGKSQTTRETSMLKGLSWGPPPGARNRHCW